MENDEPYQKFLKHHHLSDGIHGQLCWASHGASKGDLKVVRELVKKGADPTENENLAITLAVEFDKIDIVRYFLNYLKSKNILEIEFVQELVITSAEHGNSSIPKLLRETFADIYAEIDLTYPFMFGCQKGHL